MQPLRQDRLDVVEKGRANFFAWRGQFTPQFVSYLLDSFVKPSDVVVDPFAGSGTVLAECSMKGISAYGYEINPAAYAMSKFFTFANQPRLKREAVLCSLEKKVLSLIQPCAELPLFQNTANHQKSYPDLTAFAQALFSTLFGPQEKLLALNTLFIADGLTKKEMYFKIFRAFASIKQRALSLPYTPAPIAAYLSDARTIHQNCPAADCILTSPPYINVFNYHQNHRSILELVGCDMLRVAKSEIGSNRKNRGNRFRTVVQYCLDMEQALTSFWQSLKPNGILILVVGRESNVRRVPFYNGAIIGEIIREMGGFGEVETYERTFTNRFGAAIVEDILVTRKNLTPPSCSPQSVLASQTCARPIAKNHLMSAFPRAADDDVKSDIHDAIDALDKISPSPMFNAFEVRLDV